jgi:hypothetical protein
MGWLPRVIANTERKATKIKTRGKQRFILRVISFLLFDLPGLAISIGVLRENLTGLF